MNKGKNTSVSIIGTGIIGTAFALVFSRAGWQVQIFDSSADMRNKSLDSIRPRLDALAQYDLIHESTETILNRVKVFDNMQNAVTGTTLVIECGPEKLDVKQSIFAELDQLADIETILVSSSSALMISEITKHINHKERCLIAHPGNPPYLIPVVEIVPSTNTSKTITQQTIDIFSSVHMQPILVKHEIEGFVFNRLQGAILREAYCLVRDGIASVSDIDNIVKNGLGLRWSVTGPFETVDLNTIGGIPVHAKKMGPAYERMGAQRGQHDPWTEEMVHEVERQRREILPLDQWKERAAWRDHQLMQLLSNRKNSKS